MPIFSFESHIKSTAAAGILLAGCTALCRPAFAQPSLDEAPGRARQIVERIQEAEADGDVNSTELIAPLTALALLYQENGAHDLAIAAVERARQAVRVNYGLYSLEEAPLLLQAIRSEEARGNVEGAWEREQSVLTLALRHVGDSRTVPIFRQLAESRLRILEDYLVGGFPPQIVLGCYYSGGRTYLPGPRRSRCHAGSRSAAVESLWRETLSYYWRAISTAPPNDDFSSDARRVFLTRLLRTSYVHELFLDTRSLFGVLLAHDPDSPGTTESRARSRLLLADFSALTLHRREETMTRRELRSVPQLRAAVLERYEHAHRALRSSGVEQASIDEMFSPELPVVLPTFLPNPLASKETPDSTGHIDVAFEISPHGKSERIVILDTTTNASRRDEKDLVARIESLPFRPRATDGQLGASSPVVIRYYLNENESARLR